MTSERIFQQTPNRINLKEYLPDILGYLLQRNYSEKLDEIVPFGISGNLKFFYGDDDGMKARLISLVQAIIEPYGLGSGWVEDSPLFLVMDNAEYRHWLRNLAADTITSMQEGKTDKLLELIVTVLKHNTLMTINATISEGLVDEAEFPIPEGVEINTKRPTQQERSGLSNLEETLETIAKLNALLEGKSEREVNELFVYLRRVYAKYLNISQIHTFDEREDLVMEDFEDEAIRLVELASEMLISNPMSRKWELGFQLASYWLRGEGSFHHRQLLSSIFEANNRNTRSVYDREGHYYEYHINRVLKNSFHTYRMYRDQTEASLALKDQLFAEAQEMLQGKTAEERQQLLMELLLGEYRSSIQLTDEEIIRAIHATAYIEKRAEYLARNHWDELIDNKENLFNLGVTMHTMVMQINPTVKALAHLSA